MHIANTLTCLAAAAPAGGTPAQGLGVREMGYYLIFFCAVFYFLMLRPQQKKEKERKALVAAIQSGDRILFGGGIIGIVANVKEHVLIVKIANNVKIEILRESVTKVLGKGEEVSDSESEKK